MQESPQGFPDLQTRQHSWAVTGGPGSAAGSEGAGEGCTSATGVSASSTRVNVPSPVVTSVTVRPSTWPRGDHLRRLRPSWLRRRSRSWSPRRSFGSFETQFRRAPW